MRAYELVAGSNSIAGLRRGERPNPTPEGTQILVRIKAASLNFRDLMIAVADSNHRPEWKASSFFRSYAENPSRY